MGLFDNIKGLTPIKPEKEFGTHLTQLTEMALADKILTSSERTMLRNFAAARKVDMKRFDEHVNSLIQKRGIKQVNDGNLPHKKYSTAIPMASDLKNLIDMALADGYLSDEERKMILQEAKKLGVNMQTFEAGLNAMFMTTEMKNIIDSKFPTTVSKRLVSSEEVAGGKIQDTYEEITLSCRPNTNRGKEGEILRTTTKQIIKVTREKDSMESVVDFLCTVDYPTVLCTLSVVSTFNPIIGGAVTILVTTLQRGVENYKKSEQKDPKQFFKMVISEVPIEECVSALPFIQKYMGKHGAKIVSCLTTAQQLHKQIAQK